MTRGAFVRKRHNTKLSTPDWSDFRPSFDKATDDNIRIVKQGDFVRIQFHVWSKRDYRIFFSGCVLFPLSTICIAFLAVAPWGWALFALIFCVSGILAFSALVSSEFDLERSEFHDRWSIFGRTIYVTKLQYGTTATIRLRRTKYESPNVLKLEMVDDSRVREIVEFHQFATRKNALRIGAELANYIDRRFEAEE